MWAYDFVFDPTAAGQPIKFLRVVDQFTRECLAIHVAGSIRSRPVIEVLAWRAIVSSPSLGSATMLSATAAFSFALVPAENSYHTAKQIAEAAAREKVDRKRFPLA